MSKCSLEHGERRLPSCRHSVNRFQFNTSATLYDVIEHDLGMILLLLKLYLKPIAHSRIAVSVSISSH